MRPRAARVKNSAHTETCVDVGRRTKGANVTIVFITRALALPGKREPEKCLFLETPMLSTYTIEQEMLPFKAINRYQNEELLCHWISVNLKMVVVEEPPL